MEKILIIEDDQVLGESLNDYIKSEGLDSVRVESLNDARAYIKDNKMDLIILDWMLPDGQGVDFLKEFREKEKNIPVIMLTAKAELLDKVLGLESGANDYITKPFESRELIARVRVQLRNKKNQKLSSVDEGPSIIEVEELLIDQGKREVHFSSKKVELTKMEFDFLCLLAEAPKKAFSREEILNKVWGFENYPTTRTVDTHVLQLRQKLSDDLIETVRGIGYRLNREV